MDDEARLVVELLDRSGAGGAASTNPVQPGAADVPGSGVAKDFAEHITTAGAGAKAGSGSTTPTPTPIEAPSAAPAESPVASDPSGVRISVPGGDAIAPLIEQIIRDKPDITAQELAGVKELNLNAERAQQWLDRAKGTNAANVPQAPTDAPDRDLARFAQTVIRDTVTEEERYAQQLARLREARQAGLLDDDQLRRGMEHAGRSLPRPFAPDSSRGIVEAQVVPPPVPPSISDAAQSLNQTLNSMGGLDRIGGMIGGNVGATVGNLAQTAITTLPQLLPAGATATGPLAALAANAGPIAAGAGLVAAAAAIPLAAGYAALNEAERALQISRQYSPDVARAQAEADVRQVMADMRTSRRLGDEAADYLTARSRLSTGFQGVRDIVSEPVLKDLNTALTTLGNFFTSLNTLSSKFPILGKLVQKFETNSIDSMVDNLTHLPGWSAKMRRLMEDMNKKFDRFVPEAKVEGPFDWFNDQDHLPLSKDSVFSESDVSGSRPLNVRTNMPGLEL